MKKLNRRGTIYKTIVIVCLIISLSFLGFNYVINNREKVVWGKASSNFDVDYKVYNKDNRFYDDEYMDSYVSSITDRIDFDIKYYFKTTDNLDINYTYNIDGEVLAEVYESGNASPVWSKELDVSVKEISKVGDSNYLQIDKSISLPFNEYNDMMIEYKNNYNININSYIKLIMDVNIESLSDKVSNITNHDTLAIKIPLLQPTYSIDIDKTVVTDKDIYLKVVDNDNNLFLKMGIIGLIYTLCISIIFFISYKKSKSKYQLFIEKRDNILKKYEEIIIKVDQLPSVEKLEIIELNDFNDLIDLEQTINTPIMYKSIDSYKECWFVIVDNKYFYRYKFNIKKVVNR